MARASGLCRAMVRSGRERLGLRSASVPTLCEPPSTAQGLSLKRDRSFTQCSCHVAAVAPGYLPEFSLSPLEDSGCVAGVSLGET